MAQIVNLPTMYINGCNLIYVNGTTINVTAGQVRDSSNQFDIVIPNPLVINSTTKGINGLDTGSLGNNLFYNIYIVSDSSGFRPAGAILSLSSSGAPLLPVGYDLIRLIGIWLTGGSAILVNIYQTGQGNDRTFFYDVPIPVLTAGVATSFTPVNLSAAVPNICRLIELNAAYTPAAVNNICALRPTGSTSSATVRQNGIVATVEQDIQVQIPVLLASGNPSIDYMVTASGDALTLNVSAFNISL